MFNGIKAIYYREIMVMRTRVRRSILASMVSPALFLVAFGYGLGRYQVYGGLDYLDFLFAGLLAMSTLNACYSVGTDINIARFYFRTFDEYLIAPILRWEIVAGEVLFGMTKGMINVAIFFTYAWFAELNICVTPLFLVVLLMHMAIFSLMGFMVALIVRNHGDQSSISTFLITPMTFLSGVFFPVEQGPTILVWIVHLFPVSHSVSLMRASLTGGEAQMHNLVALVAFLLVFFFVALRLSKKSQG